ncbi:MAG: transcription initiation factor IIB [Candidatus Bathyarchaeota archaeon]|nr:transcription initiation factor IIB [Candidatus Termiticorpusculum sp.]MCL1970908.1 transcription initiation factor IIB [Candidatus Termiticorpusculum sp.]
MVEGSKGDNEELPEIDPILKEKITEIKKCPKCFSTKLIISSEPAEAVCMECEFVVNQETIDRIVEKKAFDEKQKSNKVKVEAPLTFTIHKKGAATVIDWHNRGDRQSKSFSTGQKAQVYYLRNWKRRVRITGSTERNLTYALSEITKTANKLHLPKNILETASGIYQKALEEHLINGRSIREIATASLYIACRQSGLSKTLDDIAHASDVDKKELGKAYRFLIKKLDYVISPLQPDQCIAKFSNKAAVQEKVEDIVQKILTSAKDSKLTVGRSPTGIAAAAGYIALVLVNERKTQKEIADIAQTTEITIRNRYRELVSRLMFEISL